MAVFGPYSTRIAQILERYPAWITPGTLEALIPGRMQSHGGTEEVPG